MKTGSLTIACQDAAMKTRLQEDFKLDQNFTVEILDLSQETSVKTLNDRAYDVILTSDLSNAIAKPDVAVKNIVKLLKKDGKMCVYENANFTDRMQNMLRDVQMDTIVIYNSEQIQSQHLNLLIAEKTEVSLANGSTEASGQEQVMLIQLANPSEAAQTVASNLTSILERSGYTATSAIWGSYEMSQMSGKSCISLVELEKSLFRDLSESDFVILQQLLLGATRILWVVGFDDPSAAMVDGLGRTVRNEMSGLSFCAFHVEEHYSSLPASLGAYIGRIFRSATEDDEFLLRNQLLHVSRIEKDEALDEQINNILPSAQERISSMPLGQVPYPTKLCIRNPGMLDSLCLEPDDLHSTELEDECIEIKVKATALK